MMEKLISCEKLRIKEWIQIEKADKKADRNRNL